MVWNVLQEYVLEAPFQAASLRERFCLVFCRPEGSRKWQAHIWNANAEPTANAKRTRGKKVRAGLSAASS
jgi:hypothetical protein